MSQTHIYTHKPKKKKRIQHRFVWKSKEEIKNNWLLNQEFKPVMKIEQRAKLLEGWSKAVRFALMWKDI